MHPNEKFFEFFPDAPVPERERRRREAEVIAEALSASGKSLKRSSRSSRAEELRRPPGAGVIPRAPRGFHQTPASNPSASANFPEKETTAEI